MGYSQFVGGTHGTNTVFDFTPTGFLNAVVTGSPSQYGAGGTNLFFDTSVGFVHVEGVSPVLVSGLKPGSEDTQNFYLDGPPDLDGNPQYYAYSKSQTITAIY